MVNKPTIVDNKPPLAPHKLFISIYNIVFGLVGSLVSEQVGDPLKMLPQQGQAYYI